MNRTQLTVNFQKACIERLELWKKYRKYGLYRRTEDFAQWLIFDVSNFDIKIRPSYSIQALATQFPTIALTLGNHIRDKRGVELWLKVDDWKNRKGEIIDRIAQQIVPPALEPLTIEAIMEFFDRFESDHESAITARGIATIIAGEMEPGYAYFRQALEKYKNIPYPWARVEEARLTGWLACAPEDIVAVLRHEAEIGAQLLGLKLDKLR